MPSLKLQYRAGLAGEFLLDRIALDDNSFDRLAWLRLLEQLDARTGQSKLLSRPVTRVVPIIVLLCRLPDGASDLPIVGYEKELLDELRRVDARVRVTAAKLRQVSPVNQHAARLLVR